MQTLTVTDIATGWTECAPLLYREQTLLREVLGEVRRRLPFELLGFDTDNDSVFVNETVRDYCRDSGIVFTRCRPWRKNDQAFVEQKNGAIVRRIVGYRRLEGLEAAAALSRLYTTTRLFVNFFQPSFKLASKRRDGARVSKRYHPPATPCQRLLADPRTPQQVRDRVAELSARLDPIRLLRQMRVRQQSIVDIVDQPVAAPSDQTSARPRTRASSTSISAGPSGKRSGFNPNGNGTPTAAASPGLATGHYIGKGFGVSLRPMNDGYRDSVASAARPD